MGKAIQKTGKKGVEAALPQLLDASNVWESYRTRPMPMPADHATNISKASSVWTRYTDGRMKQFGAR